MPEQLFKRECWEKKSPYFGHKRKLRWFGHVSNSSGLAKTILQGTVQGKRRKGRQQKRWEDKIKD